MRSAVTVVVHTPDVVLRMLRSLQAVKTLTAITGMPVGLSAITAMLLCKV